MSKTTVHSLTQSPGSQYLFAKGITRALPKSPAPLLPSSLNFSIYEGYYTHLADPELSVSSDCNVSHRVDRVLKRKAPNLCASSAKYDDYSQNPGNKSGQQIPIRQVARNTNTHGTSVRLQWIFGHCEMSGTGIIDLLPGKGSHTGKTISALLFAVTRESTH